MTNEEKFKKINEALIDQDLFVCLNVMDVNHKPHPYTVGPAHIKYANEGGRRGILNEQVCREVKCAFQGCNTSYDEHTADNVAFLQLKRNGTNEEAQNILKEVVDTLGPEFIDGFSFVETEEKFRIES